MPFLFALRKEIEKIMFIVEIIIDFYYTKLYEN